MRKIALTMLLALWTLTCRAGEPHFKLCERDAQSDTPSRFFSVAADRELFPNCLVGFIPPSTFDNPSRGTLFFASLYSNSSGRAAQTSWGRECTPSVPQCERLALRDHPIARRADLANDHASGPVNGPARLSLATGGAAYPCTTLGLRTSLSDATTQAVSTVDARACENLTLTAPITIGSVKKSVSLLIPSSGTWLLSGISNGASCFVTVLSGSSIIGQGSHNGANKFTLMNNSSSVNADSMIRTDPVVTGYVRIEGGLFLENLNGGTYINGLLHAQNLYDASSFRNITVFNPGGIGYVRARGMLWSNIRETADRWRKCRGIQASSYRPRPEWEAPELFLSSTSVRITREMDSPKSL